MPFLGAPLLAVSAQGLDFRFIRSVRLVRLFRVLTLACNSQSLHSLGSALRAQKGQFLVTAFCGFIALIIASSLMHLAERDSQPDVFGSIPSAMWWAVVTLTTVGYGDVYPKTALSKLVAGIIAVMRIGILALSAGIIASRLRKGSRARPERGRVCPHCDSELPDDEPWAV